MFVFKVTVGTENGVISAATTSTQNDCILHFYTNTEQFPSLKMCFHYLGLTDNFHLKVIWGKNITTAIILLVLVDL